MSKSGKETNNRHDLNNRRTQWHMALPSAIKLELMDYGQILEYIPEYLLNTMALKMDLLIIKKADDTVIENAIGHIFRKHNIVEYKSPRDTVGVNTYFQVYAYACLYKIGTDGQTFAPKDITITIVRKAKPVRLFQWLRTQGCHVEEHCKGIYYITDAGFFATQVVVVRELDRELHLWLTSLTDKMDRQQAKKLLVKSGGLMQTPEAEYVEALLQIVAKANKEIFAQMKKEDEQMYSALFEIMRPEIDEVVDKAVGEAVDKAVGEAVDETTSRVTAQKTVEAIENAIKKLHMSRADACAFMDTTEEEYEAYKQLLKAGKNPPRSKKTGKR